MKFNCVTKPSGSVETNTDSILHKELLKKFPYMTNVNGGSSLYDDLFSDEFVNFFGQWFYDPEKPKTKKQAEEFFNSHHKYAIFNTQGEPRLISINKESYFRNAKEERKILNPNLLKEKDKMDLINSLSNLYFSSPQKDIAAFIEETLESRKEVLSKKVDELEQELDNDLDMPFEKEESIIEQIKSLNNSVFIIEEYILTEPEVLKSIKSIMSNKLKDFSLKYEDDISEKDDDDPNTNSDIANYFKEGSETRDSNGIDSEIKAIISSIPEIITSVDGQESFKYDNILKMKMSMSANTVKNRLVELLSNIIEVELSETEYVKDPYDLMINKLQEFQVQYNDPITREFLNRLNDLYDSKSENDKEAFKTKFVNSFYLSQNIFTITEISQAGGKLTLRHINPNDTQDKESFISNEIIRSLFNKFAFYSGNSEIENNAIYEKAKKGLRSAKTKADISKNLELLGINLSTKTINELFKNKENVLYGMSEGTKKPLDKFFTEIFEQKIVFKDSNLDDERIEIKGLKNLIEYYYTKADTVTKNNIIKGLRDKDLLTPFAVLSKYEAVNKVSVSDSSMFVGSKQRWMYSKASGLNKIILGLKYGNVKMLENLEHRNLSFVNYLLAKDFISTASPKGSDKHLAEQKRRISKLDLYINSEIKKKNDPNPVLHKEIGEVDMHMDMFFKLFDDRSDIHENLDRQQNATKALLNKENKRNINVMPYTSGDKSTSYSMTGFPSVTNTVELGGNKEITGIGLGNRELVTGYLSGEFSNIQKNSLLIEEYLNKKTNKQKQEYLMTRLIPDYHYSTKVKNTLGQTVEYFPEDMKIVTSDKDGNIISTEENANLDFRFINAGTWNRFGFFNSVAENNKAAFDLLFEKVDGIKLASKKDMSSYFSGELVKLAEIELIKIAKENKKYFESIEVDSEDGTALLGQNTNIENSNDDRVSYDYVMASMFANIEMFIMFNGDLAFYKQKGNTLSMEDALKRAPAVTTDGLYLRQSSKKNMKEYTSFNGKKVKFDQNTHMSIAVINNMVFYKSKHQDAINTGLVLKGKSKGYEHEIADAQGLGLPSSHKELIGRIYGWTDADEAIHNRLLDKNYKVTRDDIKWLKGSGRSNGPTKFTGFAMIPFYDENNNYIGSFADYLKFSVAFLYPAITNGTELERVVKAMETQGVNIILSKSGSKASNRQPTTIHNESDGVFDGLKENMKLNPYLFPISGIKLQVEMPTKFDKEGVTGNQHLKNLLGNLNTNPESPGYNNKSFEFRGKKYTAKEYYDKYNSTIINILQDQLNVAIGKLGIVNNGDGSYSSSETKLRELLIAQLDESSDSDLIEIIKDNSLPLETIPGIAQRAFPIISKYIHKNYGKVLTNSASAIQVANIGFDRVDASSEEENQIAYLTEDKELRPPLPARVSDLTVEELKLLSEVDRSNKNAVVYFNEEGNPSLDENSGKMRIRQARIMLPFASVYEQTGMNFEEFKIALKNKTIDPEIFKRIIAYRIPNQSISSNDSIEIVGILPPKMGDTAIVYHEITAKTGSDFDIDKLYLMMPNFKVKREFVVPEESQKIIDALKAEKIETKQLSEYMKYQFGSGKQILTVFSANEEIEELIFKKEQEFKKKEEYIGPVKLILEIQDEINSVLANNNKKIEFGDDFIDLQDVMNDLLQAYDNQIEDIETSLDKLRTRNKEAIKGILKATGSFKGPVKSVEYIKDNSAKGYQNQLIELMQGILESQDTYNDLISPLDSPIIKDSISEVGYLLSIANEENFEDLFKEFEAMDEKQKSSVIKKFSEDKKLDPLRQMSPMHIIKARVEMLKAKKLVATMANHMTDIPMSQIVNQIMRFDIGIDSFSFGDKYVKGYELNDEYKITKIVSYLMNAAVDAAKDNYIIEGNFNSYSANGAMVMIRMGIDPLNAFKVLMNPDIMEISRFKQLGTEKMTNIINNDFSQEGLNMLSQKFVNFIQTNKLNFNDFIKYKLGSNEKNKETKELDRDLVLGFWNIIQLSGKELNNDVIASKADSNGAGENIAAHTGIFNRLSVVMKENIGSNVNNNFIRGTKLYKEGLTKDKLKFTNNIKESDMTFLGAMMNNSLLLTNLVTKNMFIENTDNYRTLINSLSAQLGNPLPTSADDIKNISKSLYPYIVSQSGHSAYNIDKSDIQDLMENFSNEMLEKKQLNPDNLFLKEIYIDASTNLVSFPNFKFFDPNDKTVLREELNGVYLQRADGIPEGAIFINKLVRYAFLTTGFKPTYFNMNEYLPKAYFLNTGHAYSISKLIERLNNSEEFLEAESIGKILTFMVVNNEDNYKIVKNIREKAIRDKDTGEIIKYKNLITSGVSLKDPKLIQQLTVDNYNHFVPAVSVNVSPTKSEKKKNKNASYIRKTYILTDIEVKQNKDGTIERYPVYEEVNTNKEEIDNDSNRVNKTKTKIKLNDLNKIKTENLFTFESNKTGILIQSEIEYISQLSRIFLNNNLTVENDSVSLHDMYLLEEYMKSFGKSIEEVDFKDNEEDDVFGEKC